VRLYLRASLNRLNHTSRTNDSGSSCLRADELKNEVAKIRWYHSIDLGNGVVTPGWEKNTASRLPKLLIPDSLQGMTVLDVGAWDGFFSFEAERRGASRVLATDSFMWERGGKAGFELARRALNSHVEDKTIDVLDLAPETVGVFDLVFFLGILYHLRHPLLALERIFKVTGKQLILETHVDMIWNPRPGMIFYPGAELHRDPTNWWGPNPAAVGAMLKSVGFRTVKLVSWSHSRFFMLGAGVYLKLTGQAPFRGTMQQNRVVFHAWR
jgi:tRNA (mo5U34)-methyltransferase